MKSIIIYLGIIFLFVGCYNREKIVDKKKLLGNDYRLFQNTSAWELAKAVEDGDSLKIEKEISKKNEIINFQEPRFGSTLLMLTIRNKQYNIFKKLLNLGADPNIGDSYDGQTAVICAAKIDEIKYLKLILKFKGNPNAREDAEYKKENDGGRQTALLAAINTYDISSLEKVKLLVNAGANINYSDEKTSLALSEALILDRLDIVLYLLKAGANYNLILYTTEDKEGVYILEALRRCTLDLNSNQYQKKKEVITFLKGKGLDYSKEPIPDHILERIKKNYPKDWSNYIKKY